MIPTERDFDLSASKILVSRLHLSALPMLIQAKCLDFSRCRYGELLVVPLGASCCWLHLFQATRSSCYQSSIISSASVVYGL